MVDSIDASGDVVARRGVLSAVAFALSVFLFFFYFWGVRFGDYLYVVQENTLFLPRLDFFLDWTSTPDGALSWLSAFFLQFAYYPLLGGAIYAFFLALGAALFDRLLRLRGPLRALAALPACCFTIGATWHGYYAFIPYNAAINFAFPFAFVLALALFALCVSFSNPYARATSSAIVVAAFYPLIGCWAPFVALLVAIREGTLSESATRRARLVRALVVLSFALLIPPLYHYFVYYSRLVKIDIFLVGLFEDVRYDKTTTTAVHAYGYTAFAVASTAVVYASTRVARLFAKPTSELEKARARAEKARARELQREERRRNAKASRRGTTLAPEPSKPTPSAEELARAARRRSIRLTVGVFAALFCATYAGSYHTKSFFQLFAAARALEACDWDRVVELDATNLFPVDGMTQFRNVALYHQGRLSEDAFARPLGGLGTIEVTEEDNIRALQHELYYQLKIALFKRRRRTEDMSNRALCELLYVYWGQTNIAARIAMNNLVAAEGRCASSLKTLALSALVSGEDKLARRYLETLEDAPFYRRWARARLALLDAPGFYDGARDYRDDAESEETIARLRRERPLEASMEAAAAKYGADLDEVKTASEQLATFRAMRPLENSTTTKAFRPVFRTLRH